MSRKKLQYKALCIAYYSSDNHLYIRLEHPYIKPGRWYIYKYNLNIILAKRFSN